jgi:hypothetical protein
LRSVNELARTVVPPKRVTIETSFKMNIVNGLWILNVRARAGHLSCNFARI